jgi:hypothetical protein
VMLHANFGKGMFLDCEMFVRLPIAMMDMRHDNYLQCGHFHSPCLWSLPSVTFTSIVYVLFPYFVAFTC